MVQTRHFDLLQYEALYDEVKSKFVGCRVVEARWEERHGGLLCESPERGYFLRKSHEGQWEKVLDDRKQRWDLTIDIFSDHPHRPFCPFRAGSLLNVSPK